MFVKGKRETTEYKGESFEINLLKDEDWLNDATAKYEMWEVGGAKITEGECILNEKSLTAVIQPSVTENLDGKHKVIVFYTTPPHNDVMFEYFITYKERNA